VSIAGIGWFGEGGKLRCVVERFGLHFLIFTYFGQNQKIGSHMTRQIRSVSSSEFSGRFGQWSFSAQAAPVRVTNQKTGMVLGYFVSEQEFEDYVRLRDGAPLSRFAWEMPDEFVSELNKPIANLHPELDCLMED
jgi:hypothetical protein